jgi:large subunit ribosomal protein L9
MKVLLREDVDNLGYAGEVANVADGYGRNYLIPRGMAVKATSSVLKDAQSWRDRAAARVEELRKEHELLAERIREARLEFFAKAGEMGKLYGSVTTMDITEQLNETLGTDIDRRIVGTGPLRQLGEHKVTVRLSHENQPQVTVVINLEEDELELAEIESEEVAEEISEEISEEMTSDEDEVVEDVAEEKTLEEETLIEEAVEIEEIEELAAEEENTEPEES